MAYELTPEEKKWVEETKRQERELYANGGPKRTGSKALQDRMNSENEVFLAHSRDPELARLSRETADTPLEDLITKYPHAFAPDED